MKKLLFALLHAFGATRFAAWRNRKRVTILCYHGVSERTGRSARDPMGLHVRRERFTAQLEYLRRRHRVISLREYLAARREGRPLPDYSVILTFDDGYRNFLTAAAPRLAERGMPVSVFIITDRIRGEDEANFARRWAPRDDEMYLSWQEVRALEHGQGVEFGSHTCTHPKLSFVTAKEAEDELSRSRVAITDCLGAEALPLAYPYGDYSDLVVEQARTLGYVCGLTTDEGVNGADTPLFSLRRTLIGDADDTPAFAARVSGLISWIRKAGVA